MRRITSTWQEYFRNRNEGLGTTYERFILHRYFERIKNRYEIQSLLEAPSFGMTGVSGINSLWWASGGARVTVIDNNRERIELIKGVWEALSLEAVFIYEQLEYEVLPFKDNSFDMGWNFAALWAVPRLEKFLSELTRVSRKAVFICIPNRLNILNRLWMASKKNQAVLNEQNMNLVKIKGIMLRLKWQVQEEGFFDVPPWPDIAMNKEDLLYSVGLKKIAGRLKEREGNAICIIDYFNGTKKEMKREVLRYAFLENAPLFFKRFWAHHHFLIFTPKQET
jgi:hypothetical protein